MSPSLARLVIHGIVSVSCLILLVACGGGGSGSASAEVVTLTYPSGRIMAQGQYLPGTSTRSGIWTEYFDESGSPRQWHKTYVDGGWDRAQEWCEWNVDGSIRNHSSDH